MKNTSKNYKSININVKLIMSALFKKIQNGL